MNAKNQRPINFEKNYTFRKITARIVEIRTQPNACGPDDRYENNNTVQNKLVNTHLYPMVLFQSARRTGRTKRPITRSICSECI